VEKEGIGAIGRTGGHQGRICRKCENRRGIIRIGKKERQWKSKRGGKKKGGGAGVFTGKKGNAVLLLGGGIRGSGVHATNTGRRKPSQVERRGLLGNWQDGKKARCCRSFEEEKGPAESVIPGRHGFGVLGRPEAK